MKLSKVHPALLLAYLVIMIGLGTSCGGTASDNQETRNLTAFARLYGYVKYFHPSDEASRIDWDKFAIYGSERIKGARDSEQLADILEELFLPIAPAIQLHHPDEQPQPFVVPEDTTGLRVVFWQHLGVQLGGRSNAYRSIRTGRDNPLPAGGYGFGTATQGIDATEHRGKDIKLTAFVRTNVSDSGNQGQLWLRVDRKDKQRGFFDNMDDRPITSREWQSYEIVGTVAEDATNIFFGCFLKGTGQVWTDTFKLSGRSGEGSWEPIPIDNPGFEIAAGDKPAKWGAGSPGYRYELVDDNPHEGENCLLIEHETKMFSGLLFDAFPRVGDVISKELVDGLWCQIPLALYSDSTGTLERGDRASLDTLLTRLSEMDPSTFSADNEYVRLGDIVILWNVFQHFYPYFDVVETDWEAELPVALEEALAVQTEEEFYATLRKLVARLHDGHGGVYHGELRNQVGLPFLVDWIEEQVVVIASTDSVDLEIGDVVVSVDGVPAEQWLLSEEELISGSSQWRRVRSLGWFGHGEEGTTASLEILRDGQILEMEVVRSKQENLTRPGRPDIEEIETGIYYVNLDKAEMDEIQEHMDDLARARGVIFDLRGYPKGNHDVIRHLLTEPDTSSAWMRVPQIIYPDREDVAGFDDHGWFLEPKEPHIEGTVVFLTDGRAISYAESFMSFIEGYELAEIVGQPTAGTNGNVNPFVLPGGFRVTWTGMRVVKHDGSQHHLIGIRPTVPVDRTLQGILEGRDEYVEKALEVIRTR